MSSQTGQEVLTNGNIGCFSCGITENKHHRVKLLRRNKSYSSILSRIIDKDLQIANY